MFAKVYELILQILFPQTCMFCHMGNKICCEKCFLEIPINTRFKDNILSLYFFPLPKINKLIWKMKYHHAGGIAKLFGGIMAEKIQKEFFVFFPPNPQIYLIPIPLNQNDKRLHNHAELLANEIKQNLCDAIVLKNILLKNSKQKQSHTKSREERFENIQNAFFINPQEQKHPNPSLFKEGQMQTVQNQQSVYIIVDDVTTSGATLNSARHTLSTYLNIPPAKILAITVAY